jgi:CBS domain containing-hemolysin-like protein
LNVKDLLANLASGQGPADVRRLMRPPYFVPEHKKLDSLLQQFKKRKTHMAIVVDEHGAFRAWSPWRTPWRNWWVKSGTRRIRKSP